MSHFISQQRAAEMIRLYRENRENITSEPYRGQDVLAFSETFSRDAFDALLGQADCQSLRIYYGMDADLKVHAIIYGVNSKGQDIVTQQTNQEGSFATATTTEEDIIVEMSVRCPPDCPPPPPPPTEENP